MRFATLFAALATAASVQAAWSDGGNLPEDHIMRAKPKVALNARKATTSKSTTAATSTVAVVDPNCTNSPTSRNCWSNGYSVATDFDAKWPTTGVTRYYTLTASNTTCSQDGSPKKQCFLWNGQFPGPTITANWGDYIQVTVQNNMKSNGTGVHWHGVRMSGTCPMDGVGGVTECPIAPGHSTTYFFQATQFGTSWYHSHHGVQYGDGLLGPLVINGPASSNYDTDLGPLTMNDYYYQTATNGDLEYFRFISDPTFSSPNPTPDNILLNGTNMNAAGTAGKYLKVQLTKGKRHLLRLINASVDSALTVSLDGHNLTIVTSDFVPIQPLTVSSLMINIGQRYEVIIEANQTPGNYWFRAQTQTACASVNNNPNGGLGIFSYAGVKVANPTTTSSITDPGCNEPSPLVPYVVNTVGSSSDFIAQSKELDIDFPVEGVSSNGQNILQWGVNMSALDVSWDKPTMSYLIEGNNSFPITENLIEIANEGIWTFWVVQEVGFAATPHPIHLHGHDFYILGRGAGAFDYTNGPASLQYNNPTRRDVATLPSGGWMVMAFMTDNPGIWLMHCHIAWHVSQGLGVQFLEAPGSFELPGAPYTQQCSDWNAYWKNSPWEKEGSGL